MPGCILISLSEYHRMLSPEHMARPFRLTLMQAAKAPGQVMRDGRAICGTAGKRELSRTVRSRSADYIPCKAFSMTIV